jgi:hypothetical protein
VAKQFEPLEREIVAAFRKQLYYKAPAIKWVGIPNAGKRGMAAIRYAKQEGLSPGFPDGMCLWAGAGLLFIEWKRPLEPLRENQVEWGNRLWDMGFKYALCSSVEEGMAALRAAGAPVERV